MLLVETESARGLRRPGWLLALSPLPFVLWLAAAVATLSGTGVASAADLTPEQLDSIRVGWILQWPLYAAAVIVGAIGMAMLNNMLRGTSARGLAVASQAVVGVSVAAVLGCLVLVESVVGFTADRLGSDGAYRASVALSYLAIWAAAVAVVLTGAALRTSGTLRRTGLVVAVLAGLFLVADVLTRGFPPFVVAFLWLALGVGLLRRRVPSQA